MATPGHIKIMSDCTTCRAQRGEPCMTYDGHTANYQHGGRVVLSRSVADISTILAMFTPEQ